MVIKNCAICGKEFVFRINANIYTCSNVCRGIWQTKPKEQRTCAHDGCDVMFVVPKDHKAKKYCSSTCASRASNAKRRKFSKCAFCGKDYSNPKKTFCSRDCYKADQRSKPFERLSFEGKRARIIEEQNSACNKCQRTEWFDCPLPLQIDHIDGNSLNDKRENLVGLCGNCHSITPTWRGRNIKRIVTDEEMTSALSQTSTIRQALLLLGMAPKGGNYDRAKRMKAELVDSVGVEPTMRNFHSQGD